jgi:CDGSH-type Zn-finger protein/truncated hemoglobin YjbI
MADIVSDTPIRRSRPAPTAGRHRLITLLCRASELEHGVACACWFAACSLKIDASEGGLTDEQADVARGWKRSLLTAAETRMANLGQVSRVMAALGAAPHLTAPSFLLQAPASGSPFGLALEPFSPATIERLAIVGRTAFGELYSELSTSLADTPEGHSIAQLSGDGSDTLGTMQAEYSRLVAKSGQADTTFEPARSVVTNPTRRWGEASDGATPITAEPAGAVADLFDDAYDTMLVLMRLMVVPTDEIGMDEASASVRRLMNSVIRPLGEALTQLPVDTAVRSGRCAGPTFADGIAALESRRPLAAKARVDERLWRLATRATALRAQSDLPAEFLEATAALQELGCRFAPSEGPHDVASRLAELKEMQVGLESSIDVAVNGPYLVTNADNLYTWLGERIPTQPQMALCRCGASATKPFCDGAHACIDFTGRKDPKRVPDRRATFVGVQVTVLDNRGLCQHSGFCTDRLATAFRANQEPFVAPSGGRMDEIIRAVRDCPSGALSYAIDGAEARGDVDRHGTREPGIVVSKDGPYRVTGGIPLRDATGQAVPRNQGASREHYALCRCGHSRNKPFCSGMHWYVEFHDPVPDPDRQPTVFEWVGGYPALLRMTRYFYEKLIPEEPLLAPVFANMAADHPERVASWLSEVFGGPKVYSTQYGGYTRMISQHLGKGITEEMRQRWAVLLTRAAQEAGLPNDPEFASVFSSYVEWGSRLAVENSSKGAKPPEHMPMPHWEWNTAAGPPGSRVSALGPSEEELDAPVVLPAAGEAVSFAAHIKSLFRRRDRQSMSFAFDLWSYDDVKSRATAILARLRAGTMPCDGAWPAEKVEVFQRWVDSGTPR